MTDVLAELIALSRTLGDPSHDLAILAEGNTSARAEDGSFFVKASGFSMRTIGADGFVLVRSRPILEALDGPDLTDDQVREVLANTRLVPNGPALPSVETFMHAYLLELPEVTVVGHAHPTPLVSLLSLANAEAYSKKRIFPDEVVCCGPASAFVPYVDPGLPLARAIRASVENYVSEYGSVPKTIWLANHGLIALGKSTREIESAMLMSVKAARAWLGALGSGQPINAMTPAQIDRIHTRPDEHYRQRLLWAISRGG